MAARPKRKARCVVILATLLVRRDSLARIEPTGSAAAAPTGLISRAADNHVVGIFASGVCRSAQPEPIIGITARSYWTLSRPPPEVFAWQQARVLTIV